MNTAVGRATLAATSLIGDAVKNSAGENLGVIKDLMIDVEHGGIAYAVLSFGGFLGMGDKLFAIPWSRLEFHPETRTYMLDISAEMLQQAEGFPREHWPDIVQRNRSEHPQPELFGERPYGL